MLDDKEIDPEIGKMVQEAATRQGSVLQLTTQQPVSTTSSGSSSINGEPIAGGRVLVARPYKPATEGLSTIAEDNGSAESTLEPVPGGGSAVFVEDAVAGTAQVGPAVVTEKDYRAAQGGIAGTHPLLQPLEECDIFGNPIGDQAGVAMPVRPTLIPSSSSAADPAVKPRRSATFESSTKCEHVIENNQKPTAPPQPQGTISDAALDRLFSQMSENLAM